MLTKTKRSTSIGYGFMPEESQLHFLVEISRSKDKDIKIFERARWEDGEVKIDYRHDTLKVLVAPHKWEKIKDTLHKEFNLRLGSKKYKSGSWIAGKNPVHRLLGKELVLLAWVVADCDPSNIDSALKNWLGLRPEERWWLYTMTNATSGGLEDNFGWRKAIRYALTENPVTDNKKRESLFFNLNEDEI